MAGNMDAPSHARNVKGRALPVVLIVEDVKRHAEVWAKQASHAFTPIVCGSVAEAREAIVRLGKTVRAVVLDNVLPDGRGLELLEEIRPNLPRTPVLVVTGYRV